MLADYQDGWVLGKKCDSHEMGLVPKTYLERVELEPVVVTEDFATDDARTLAVKKGERLAVVGQLPCDDPNVVPWALVIRPATGEAAEDGYWYCHPGYCPSNVLAAVAKLDVLATHEAEAEGELTVYEGEGSYVWLLPGGDDKMSVVLDRRGATGTVPKAKLSAPPPEPAVDECAICQTEALAEQPVDVFEFARDHFVAAAFGQPFEHFAFALA